MLLLWNVQKKHKHPFFCSIHQRLFSEYSAHRRSCETNWENKENVWASTAKCCADLWAQIIQIYSSFQSPFSEWLFLYRHTKQKHSIMQSMLTLTYNMWAWTQLSLKTGFTSWKEIKFWASVQITHSSCHANWRKSFLRD